ncbi:MAG: hypothetical protein U0414_03095 [Polyangiaceae bacterium]
MLRFVGAAFALALTGCQLVSGLHDVDVIGADDGVPPPDPELPRCLSVRSFSGESDAPGAALSWVDPMFVMSSAGAGSVQFRQTDTTHWDECYVSVKLIAANPTPGAGSFLAGLALGQEEASGPNSFALYWDAVYKAITTPFSTIGSPVTRTLVSKPSHLGLAFHDGRLHLLYAVNGAWEAPLTTTDRPAFLDGDAGGHLFIRFESDFGGTASFADVDALTVRLSDL